MSKLRWGALGLAVLSVGLLATPASANSKTSIKTKGKELYATLTDCPANAAPGTKCLAWVVDAAQLRVKQDGTVDKQGSLFVDKYDITITANGYDSAFVGTGFGTPSRLQVANNLSKGSASGSVDLQTCDPQGSNCTSSKVTISFDLSANSPLSFTKGRVVNKFDSCRQVDRFNYRSRGGDGKGTVNGQAVVTTPVQPSFIGRSDTSTILRGSCPLP